MSSDIFPVMIRETSRISVTSCAWRVSVAVDDRAAPAVALCVVERPVEQHAGPADDRVERRAELVRQRGQKFILRPIGGFGFATGRELGLEQRRRSRSAFTRSVTSLTKPVKSGGTVGTLVIDTSTGNSWPSDPHGGRVDAAVDEWPCSRIEIAFQTLAVPIAQLSGMISVASSWPIAWSREYPNILSAALLNSVMRPC